MRVWRLADGTPVGEPLAGHDGPVHAVAAGTLPDGTPVIISGGGDGRCGCGGWPTAPRSASRWPATRWVSAVAAGALPDGTPVIISGGATARCGFGGWPTAPRSATAGPT